VKIVISIVATIFLVIIVYTGTIPYTYDKSPTIIDLSNYLPEKSIHNKFIVPHAYYGTDSNQNYFTFILSFRSNELPFKTIGPNPANTLRIIVRAEKNIDKLRGNYTARNIMAKYEPVSTVSGFEIYEAKIGKNKSTTSVHYIKLDKNNNPIVITRSGNLNLRVYRSIGNGLELDYVFSNQLKIEHWEILDKYILNVLSAFKTA